MPIGLLTSENFENLEAFNREARALQESAGVNPDDCMQIIEVDEVLADEYGTIFPKPYLEYIADRKYPTPKPSYGERVHDEGVHFRKAVEAHPRIVGVYAAFAAHALAVPEKIGWATNVLDGAMGMSVHHIFTRMHEATFKNAVVIGSVAENVSLVWGPLQFTPEVREELYALGVSHAQKINGIELPDFGE